MSFLVFAARVSSHTYVPLFDIWRGPFQPLHPTSLYGSNLFKFFSEKNNPKQSIVFRFTPAIEKHLGIRKPSCNFSLSIQHSAVVYGMWVWSTVLFLLAGHSPLWRNIKQAKNEGKSWKISMIRCLCWSWVSIHEALFNCPSVLAYLNQRYQTIYTILQLVNLGQKYNKYITNI